MLGQGSSCYVIPTQAISGTTPIISRTTDLNGTKGVSYLLVTTSTVAGSWKVEVSNDYSGAGGGNFMQPPTAGDWVDITSAFSPSIAAVTSGGSSQFVQMGPLSCRTIRVTFTPTSGAGNVRASIAGGSY
jgi:hypothetical protein